MPFTRTTARRSRPRANNQPPTLRRENAEVIYETVDDVDLSGGVDQLLTFFSQTYDGQRHSVNTATSRPYQVAPATHVVNGRRLEPEPQLPVYTMNPRSNEMTVDATPSESLPTYAETSKAQGKSQDDKEGGMSTSYSHDCSAKLVLIPIYLIPPRSQ